MLILKVIKFLCNCSHENLDLLTFPTLFKLYAYLINLNTPRDPV